ncbi:hypothetical protein [Mycolicibacterium phlei]|uniref:hypothetical protein n=1 Tax=Mycolicibacterium phlei TaxID=1771 RepID=UPI0012FF5328|nr:hypothetical protein [Mycolicibacterium phlei]
MSLIILIILALAVLLASAAISVYFGHVRKPFRHPYSTLTLGLLAVGVALTIAALASA